jgi:radical SAM superfamily enzyme YgiQ (UPF0313 family)
MAVMTKSSVLLCNPLFLNQSAEERESSSPYFPLGLLYLAAYIRERGHEVSVFDGTFASGEEEFVNALQVLDPDIVGITALMPTKSAALRLAEIAKEAGKRVIIGGPDPTYDPKAYLKYPQVDIVVHHEGEITLVVLLDLLGKGQLTAENLQNEPGIAFRDDDGRPVVNPPRPYIQELDSLPFPARDLIDMEKYLETWREQNGYTSLTLSTSRGCPYGCEWCSDAVHGQGYRQRSPENVTAELKQLKATYEIDRLRVVDDVDGIDRDWLEEWARTAEAQNAVIPFEALNDLERQDIPMLDVRDSL